MKRKQRKSLPQRKFGKVTLTDIKSGELLAQELSLIICILQVMFPK